MAVSPDPIIESIFIYDSQYIASSANHTPTHLARSRNHISQGSEDAGENQDKECEPGDTGCSPLVRNVSLVCVISLDVHKRLEVVLSSAADPPTQSAVLLPA